MRFIETKRWAALLSLMCFVGLGLMMGHWLVPEPLVRSLELSGWHGSGSLTANDAELMRQAAADWRPYPALMLLAAGGLVGAAVFAGPLARRLSRAAAWVLILLVPVHWFEFWLLGRFATRDGPHMNAYGLGLQVMAFLGYALMPMAAVVAVLGALTACARLAVDWHQPETKRHSDGSAPGPETGTIRIADSPSQNGHGTVTLATGLRDHSHNGQGNRQRGADPGGSAHWLSSSKLPDGRETGDLGICLSGGGIRSATFAMGALQALQEQDPLAGPGEGSELTRARYLTAVSGGAYTAGAFLLAVQPARPPRTEESRDGSSRQNNNGAAGRESEPDYDNVFTPGSTEFDYLRKHSSYIADGLREWSTALLIVIRGAFLSTLFLALMALVAGRWAGHLYWAFGRQGDLSSPWEPIWGGVFAVLGVAVIAVACWLTADWMELTNRPRARRGFAEAARMSWVAVALLVFLGAVIPTVSGTSMHVIELLWGQGAGGVLEGAVALKGGALGAVGVLTTILGLIHRQRANVLNTIRDGKGNLERWLGDAGGRAVRWLPVLGGMALVIAVYTTVFGCATFYAANSNPGDQPLVTWGSPSWQSPLNNLWLTVVLTLAFAIIYAAADETAMGLHPFYRRRLASAFAVRRTRGDETDRTDEFRAEPYSYDEPTGLETYGAPRRENKLLWPQVIFCASAHCSDPDETPPGRHVLPFTFSFDAIGGPEVEWCQPTVMRDGVGGRKLKPCLSSDLTVESAMAVSGAAFASAAGSARVPANMIMALINARLGTWIANPQLYREEPRWWRARPPRVRRLSYLLREIFAMHPKDFPMLFVTDGAHYESLGLVELMRHRCSEIYCFDASSDSETFAASIARAITLAYDELGVTVRLDDPDRADPRRSRSNGDPEELKNRIADTPIITGLVTYPELPGVPARTGVLVIGRTTLDHETSWEIRRHAASHPMFPNDATGDQWFDDGKFNAYTGLGRHVGKRAIKAMKAQRCKLPPSQRQLLLSCAEDKAPRHAV